MPLPASGPISLNDIQTEFGGSNPISISEYYRGGGLVPNVSQNNNIPTSGTISFNNFYGGTQVFILASPASPVTSTYDIRAQALAAGWNGSSRVQFTNNATMQRGMLMVGPFPGGITVVNNAQITGAPGTGGATGGGVGGNGGAGVTFGSLPAGNWVFTNNSVIYGGGGGGGGGLGNVSGGPMTGGNGGPAILINAGTPSGSSYTPGTISGGGGGGGGTSGFNASNGSGGGGGASFGGGGARGNNGSGGAAGNAGGLTTGGGGGVGGAGIAPGGNGGNLGANGSTGFAFNNPVNNQGSAGPATSGSFV